MVPLIIKMLNFNFHERPSAIEICLELISADKLSLSYLATDNFSIIFEQMI